MRFSLLIALIVSWVFEVHGEDDVGTFWYYTDIHVDMHYKINDSSSFWGSYAKDASPLVAFTGIETGNDQGYAENQPDFVIYGGDSVPKTADVDEQDAFRSLAFVVHHLKQAFDPEDVPLFPVLGDYDIAPESVQKKQINPETDWCIELRETQRLWKTWIDQALESISEEQKLPLVDFGDGCYHSMVIGQDPKLLLLGLNSWAWYTKNPDVNESIRDPLNQFTWLQKSLDWARAEKAKAMLITHIPPGVNEWESDLAFHYRMFYNDRLTQLIRDYSDVITTVLSGHEHVDTFRVVLNTTYHPIGTIFLAPSISPKQIPNVGSLNPRIRRYKYSRRTGQIVDYQQFWLNLEQKHPQWEVEYVASEAYGLKNLSAQSLADMLDTLTVEDNKNGLWEAYWKHQLGGRPHDLPASVGDSRCPTARSKCRCKYVCAMRHVDTTAAAECHRICESSDKPQLPTIHDLINHVSDGTDQTGLIVGLVVGLLGVALIGAGIGYYCYRKRRYH